MSDNEKSKSAPSDNRRDVAKFIVGGLVILVLALMVYSPVFPGSFIMDDHRLVETDNPLVNGQLTPGTIWFQTDFPLSILGFWTQWQLWGNNPGGYHVVNVVLHVMSAILLWRILAGLKIPGAWLAGAVYAVHPVCVNSVARIAEFKNTLSLPFFLLSVWLYIPWLNPERRDAKLAHLRYSLALVMFILAMLSKTSTVMLPLALLALALWKGGMNLRRNDIYLTPFIILAAAFGLMSAWFQKHQAMVGGVLPPETFPERIAMAGRIFWFYLGKIIWPANLNLVYPQWTPNASSVAAWLPDVLVIAALLGCWIFRKSWGKHALLALGVFGILLFPALGFFASQFLTKWRVSDHLQYLPMIAPIALCCAGIETVSSRTVRWGFAVIVVLTLSFLSYHRAHLFSSEDLLFRDTVAKNPSAWGTWSDLGVIAARQQNYSEAIADFQTSLKVNPANADAESNLGLALVEEGKLNEAEPLFRAALKLKPNDAETHSRLAMNLARQGKFSDAAGHYRIALALAEKPSAGLRLQYANALHATGNLHESANQYRKVLAQKPDSVEALNNLAWLLATAPDDSLRNGPEAVQLAEQATQLPSRNDICVPGTLAAAYAEVGRFEDAVRTAEQAVKAERAAGDNRFAVINEQLLRNYRAGKPIRERPIEPETKR